MARAIALIYIGRGRPIWARGRANQRAVERERDIDAVIGLALSPTHTKRGPGVLYALLTDHTNLLSKRRHSFGVHIPEAFVRPSWNTRERRVLDAQDHVFAMSRYVERSVAHDYGVSPNKIVVVRAGPSLDVDFKRDGVVKNYRCHNVLFVGLDPIRKGLPTLLRAFEQVARAFPDAHLDVVGVHGPPTAHVRYHGRIRGEPLKQLFYGAQIFAMPSIREPFGIVFLEAMWSGAVCIGANHSAMPEIIDDGVTGYVVEPQDERELSRRIIELFANPDR
jgi:glycosyltransferase involved in cell wall biosynthesis